MTFAEKGYFTEKYYKKHPDVTKKCCECGKEFGTEIKVNDKKPVYCCRNMFSKHNPCAHAYCNGCWMTHRFGRE